MTKKVTIVGGGLTGLVMAYRLLKRGVEVTIVEKGKELGGLLAGTTIEGASIEKAYHHIFKTDSEVIELIDELGLAKKLKWYPEKTAVYYNNTMWPFNGPLDLIKFKPLNFISKIRLGLVKIWLEKDNGWHKYESVTAVEWMKKWCGAEAYKVIWEPLLKGKFHGYYDKVSMAWMWARIHTRANSNGQLGYMSGGFEQIITELSKRIKDKGGKIQLNYELRITNYELKNEVIIYTGASKDVDYLGAVVVMMSSEQNLSDFYWHNINDSQSPFLAFIQHTNLVSKKWYQGKNVYYMGTYVPTTHPTFQSSDQEITTEFLKYLVEIFPNFDKKKVSELKVFKLRNAQHIVTTNYQTPKFKMASNVYQVNFAQIYPEDRGINYAVKSANEAVKRIKL